MLKMLRQTLLLVFAVLSIAPLAQAGTIGIVVMHGKGGAPTKHVAELASALEARGYLVANLDMPWSGGRAYDVPVAEAEREVAAALDGLRAKGATRVFVAGHSQGGLFALYFGGRQPVDGVIAIAPGGSVNTDAFRQNLGETLAQARRLAAEGRAEEKTRLLDYEGARGTFPVLTTPAIYLGWFEPEGAMNVSLAARRMNPKVPVLYIAPTGDYPGLKKSRQATFDALPRHPMTRLYEPEASHLQAPSASVDEIVRWTAEVAGGGR